jgi:RNA polymerase sigma factor (sigma-70 family)
VITDDEFRQWWIDNSKVLLKHASARAISKDSAQDLVHDMLLLALKDLSRFETIKQLDNWAVAKLGWLAIDECRAAYQQQKNKRKFFEQDESSWQAHIPSQTEDMACKDILLLIEELPERQRAVMKDTIMGSSNKEIAEKLGVDIATVRSHLRFARLRLARMLERKGG